MSRYAKRGIRRGMPRAGKINRPGRKTDAFYTTPAFGSLTPGQRRQLDSIRHQWTLGDRFYKLAHLHYGSPDAWWVIALYNGYPTDAHVPNGSIIYIPTPVGRVMSFYGF